MRRQTTGKVRLSLALLIFSSLLLSCSEGLPPQRLPGDPNEGRAVFESFGCRGCHKVNGQGGSAGPDLSDMGRLAGTLRPGMNGEAFLREAILRPDALVEEGYQTGVMPQDYGQKLSGQELDDLVAYLLTLK